MCFEFAACVYSTTEIVIKPTEILMASKSPSNEFALNKLQLELTLSFRTNIRLFHDYFPERNIFRIESDI